MIFKKGPLRSKIASPEHARSESRILIGFTPHRPFPPSPNNPPGCTRWVARGAQHRVWAAGRRAGGLLLGLIVGPGPKKTLVALLGASLETYVCVFVT